MKGQFTHYEILSQPEVWRQTLEAFQQQKKSLSRLKVSDFEEVIFTGCGSTYYLAIAAATLLRELTGVYAKALPASEIWLYPESSYDAKRKTLLIAVSRSGTTTETVEAVKRFQKRAKTKGKVITLSCYPKSDLPELGNANFMLEFAQETSIAQTRAFSALYLATVALALHWAGQDLKPLKRLPGVCERLLKDFAELAKQAGSSSQFDRFYFLGSGARYGLACELSLKMKEMTLSHSEPFHFMEFRHGPMSMTTSSTLLIALVSEKNCMAELAVLDDMRKRGAEVLSLAETEAVVAFESGLSEAYRNVLYLPVIQLLAYERSLAKGLDPDKPHNLEAVVVLGV